jgi:pimeloyl-ACP methyl ester carboxylesterase
MTATNPAQDELIATAGPGADPETTRAIDVGGRRLVLTCSGQGAPTVVLETGLGAESDAWQTVQRGIASVTRVVRYDRAWRGASDPAPRPRTARHLADDLSTLLLNASIPGPYVLVGHSLGGLVARVFAHRYPSVVAGLVLVDSAHEDQFDVFGPTFPPPQPEEPQGLTETRKFWTTGWRDPSSTTEGIDLPAACAQAREVNSLGRLPIHVITAGTFLNQPLLPEARRPQLQRMWDGLQEQFLRLSPNATHTRIMSSGHFIQREAPDRVVRAVLELLERVR